MRSHAAGIFADELRFINQKSGIAVYPRECGGTLASGFDQIVLGGLSPRVRGNRRPAFVSMTKAGSIPASAGEPLRLGVVKHIKAVYPRECGGTASITRHQPPATSLSPRVRGNRIDAITKWDQEGSIPASAGEPVTRISIWPLS